MNNERAEVVKAMETIARCINDEEIFYGWLMVGVADGDIDENTTLEDIYELGYTDNDTFAELMGVFLRKMALANKSGGLYCDGIVSK